MSKGKIAPLENANDGRRDSMDSVDTLVRITNIYIRHELLVLLNYQRAESVGESDCTMTENEDNDHPMKKETIKVRRNRRYCI